MYLDEIAKAINAAIAADSCFSQGRYFGIAELLPQGDVLAPHERCAGNEFKPIVPDDRSGITAYHRITSRQSDESEISPGDNVWLNFTDSMRLVLVATASGDCLASSRQWSEKVKEFFRSLRITVSGINSLRVVVTGESMDEDVIAEEFPALQATLVRASVLAVGIDYRVTGVNCGVVCS